MEVNGLTEEDKMDDRDNNKPQDIIDMVPNRDSTRLLGNTNA